MGFSWAMWFVQQVSESHTKEVIPESHLVRDGRPAPDIRGGESAASAYCDNIGVVGTDSADVLRLREEIQEVFKSSGF